MSAARSRTFLEFLKAVLVPVSSIAYVLGVTAGVRKDAAILGWRIVFLVVFCLTVAWSVYAWTARELTVIEPRQLKRRFGAWVRYGAIVAALVALVPLALSLWPEPGMPKMPIHLVNRSKVPISVSCWGEFFLSVPSSPLMDIQVDSGRIEILAEDDPDASYVTVDGGSSRELFAAFVNSGRFVVALDAGDRSARFVFYQKDGQILTQGEVRFTRKNIGERYMLLELKEPREPDPANREGAYNPSLERAAQAPPLSS